MKLYFSIPDFYLNFNINSALLNLMDEYPEMFHEDIVIDSVYGSFPCSMWNGGRTIFGTPDAKNVENTLAFFNNRGIICRFTFTNCLLEEGHLYDTWCNLQMEKAKNGMNAVIVNSELLENYIREKYPQFPLISSTTKCLRSIDEFNKDCEKDYQLNVLHYDFSNKFDELEKITHPEKVEIIVNEYCIPDCRAREAHYKALSAAQHNFERCQFGCSINHNTYADVMRRPHYVSYDDILKKYAPKGFNHFKVVGRTANKAFVAESYVQYFAKPEHQSDVRMMLMASITR